MLDFINSIGLPGVMGLLGCWLLVGAIVGKLIAVSHVLRQEVLLPRMYQRISLGLLGGILLGPGLHTLYYGSSSRLVSPTPQDYVSPAEGVNHTSLRLDHLNLPQRNIPIQAATFHPARFTRAAIFQARGCRKVESFGLYAHNLRQLKYAGFQGQVYLYVGDVESPKRGATTVYLFSTSASAPADGKIDDPTFQHLWSGASSKIQQAVRSPGDSFPFPYGKSQYQLTVAQIYKVMIGSDEIMVDVCEL